MKISCKFCGASNEIYPDERIIRCSFCGNTIAVEETEELRHLIMIHNWNDDRAKAAFESYMLERAGSAFECNRIEHYYVPFSRRGDGSTIHSVSVEPKFKELRIHEPYGIFSFYEDYADEAETATDSSAGIIAPVQSEELSEGLFHIPIYEIHYRTKDNSQMAFVVGETWQVISSSIPKSESHRVRSVSLKIPAVLFVTFLALSFISDCLAVRLLVVLLSGGIASLIFSLREWDKLPWKN